MIATAVLLLGSVSAYAANTASAGLQNIQAKYLSGEAVSLLSSDTSGGINHTGDSLDGQHFWDYFGTFYPIQNTFKVANFPGVGYGSGQIIANTETFEVSTEVIGYAGGISSSTDVWTYIDYKANSLLLISANAWISGAFSSVSNEYNQWYASSYISVASYNSENGIWFDTNYSARLSANSFLSAAQDESKLLNIFYYNTEDTRLSLQFGTTAFVALVPEPSTYALLGLGLGVLGFAASRRKSA